MVPVYKEIAMNERHEQVFRGLPKISIDPKIRIRRGLEWPESEPQPPSIHYVMVANRMSELLIEALWELRCWIEVIKVRYVLEGRPLRLMLECEVILVEPMTDFRMDFREAIVVAHDKKPGVFDLDAGQGKRDLEMKTLASHIANRMCSAVAGRMPHIGTAFADLRAYADVAGGMT